MPGSRRRWSSSAQIEQEQTNRHKLGRAKFVERVWQWKEESGGTIIRQLRRLGASPTGRARRFTMDAGLSAAVRKVFVELYRKGLIYRDKRLVNWDPKLHTAISDLEVENEEMKGFLWHFKYPIEGLRTNISSSPRPGGDDAGRYRRRVHPEDERYRHLVGRHAILPLVGRRLPIVATSMPTRRPAAAPSR